MKMFGREPALLIGVISAVLSLLATLNIPHLTAAQAALIVAAVNAATAVVMAIHTRPVAPAVFTGCVAALIALAAGYGLHVAPATVGGLNTVVLALLALLTRSQVSPLSDAGPGVRRAS